VDGHKIGSESIRAEMYILNKTKSGKSEVGTPGTPSPSEGRPAATAHRDRHTRPVSKLPACPPRMSAPHPRPQLGAKRARDAPAAKSRLHFCPLEHHLMLVNLKAATMLCTTISQALLRCDGMT
jgi:hypothetical protein